MEIFKQKNGEMTRAELLEVGALLVKAGYTVRRTKRRVRSEDKYATELLEVFPDGESGDAE